jgi:hypothetical protein
MQKFLNFSLLGERLKIYSKNDFIMLQNRRKISGEKKRHKERVVSRLFF